MEAKLGGLAGLAARYEMSRGQLLLASAVLTTYVLLQGWQVVTHADDWPLSAYKMYSGLQGGTAVRDRVVGVSSDGEFPLTSRHTKPLRDSRLRHVLAQAARSRRVARALEVVVDNYEQRRDGSPASPELLAIRHYRETWALDAKLRKLDKPKRKLVQAVLAFSKDRRRVLQEEAKGRAQPQAGAPLPEGDILLSAADAALGAGVSRGSDKYASVGVALRFKPASKRSLKKPTAGADDGATWEFTAPAGTYWLWLRGKAGKGGERADSVWVQVDTQLDKHYRGSADGYGRFAEAYPARAYGWSSQSPGAKPKKVVLRGDGKHRLRLLAREADVSVDQVVLSRSWREHPSVAGWVK